MFCNQCGNQVSEDSKFCGMCGARFEVASATRQLHLDNRDIPVPETPRRACWSKRSNSASKRKTSM